MTEPKTRLNAALEKLDLLRDDLNDTVEPLDACTLNNRLKKLLGIVSDMLLDAGADPKAISTVPEGGPYPDVGFHWLEKARLSNTFSSGHLRTIAKWDGHWWFIVDGEETKGQSPTAAFRAGWRYAGPVK